MKRPGTTRSLAGHERGSTVVEFALITPVFIGMICGFVDFAYWTYVKASATGALERVARSASVGGSSVNTGPLETPVQNLIKEIANTATFVWTKKSYYQFSGIGKPEKLTSDYNANGQYDLGDCWEDSNPGGNYDSAQGTTGVGGADDIVYYSVKVNFTPLIPLSGLFPFIPTTRSVTATTMVKRQPFAAQATPPIVCK